MTNKDSVSFEIPQTITLTQEQAEDILSSCYHFPWWSGVTMDGLLGVRYIERDPDDYETIGEGWFGWRDAFTVCAKLYPAVFARLQTETGWDATDADILCQCGAFGEVIYS